MTKFYSHYGLTEKVGRLDLEEQMELVSDSNDILIEKILFNENFVLIHASTNLLF